MSDIPNAERVLTAVGGLALFALNEVRMFQALPRMPDPGNGQTHAATIQIMDAAAPVYLSLVDLTVRWGLVALVVEIHHHEAGELEPLGDDEALAAQLR